MSQNSSSPRSIARAYFAALAAKDFAAAGALMADDITWHQPGDHRFSGVHQGAPDVGALIGGMMAATGGTFELSLTGELLVNGDAVAAHVRFTAQREGAAMDLTGIDLLRIAGDRIAQVHLFTDDQTAEDTFWNR